MGKFRSFFKQSKSKSKPAEAPLAEVSSPETMDEELIAVLTAAVAASLNTSTYNLKIRSYRRIKNTVPVWGMAGRSQESAAV